MFYDVKPDCYRFTDPQVDPLPIHLRHLGAGELGLDELL